MKEYEFSFFHVVIHTDDIVVSFSQNLFYFYVLGEEKSRIEDHMVYSFRWPAGLVTTEFFSRKHFIWMETCWIEIRCNSWIDIPAR